MKPSLIDRMLLFSLLNGGFVSKSFRLTVELYKPGYNYGYEKIAENDFYPGFTYVTTYNAFISPIANLRPNTGLNVINQDVVRCKGLLNIKNGINPISYEHLFSIKELQAFGTYSIDHFMHKIIRRYESSLCYVDGADPAGNIVTFVFNRDKSILVPFEDRLYDLSLDASVVEGRTVLVHEKSLFQDLRAAT